VGSADEISFAEEVEARFFKSRSTQRSVTETTVTPKVK